jgi:hypothetical protein
MNIKIITIFMAALLLPLNSFAFEGGENTLTYGQQHSAPLIDAAWHTQNLQTQSYQQIYHSKPSMSDAPVERQSEQFIEICVYIIIVMVYSLYWMMSSPNESNHRR